MRLRWRMRSAEVAAAGARAQREWTPTMARHQWIARGRYYVNSNTATFRSRLASPRK